jgi:hypothetical protein
VASSQPAESASTNKRSVVDGGVPNAVERYVEDLQRAPLAARTRDAYAGHVGAYGRWLTGRPEAAAALVEPRARDHAARDFKRHLKLERGWKPSSVNLALAAVDHFNRFLGLPRAQHDAGCRGLTRFSARNRQDPGHSFRTVLEAMAAWGDRELELEPAC